MASIELFPGFTLLFALAIPKIPSARFPEWEFSVMMEFQEDADVRVNNWQYVRRFFLKHPKTRASLQLWKIKLHEARWKTFADVKNTFGHRADLYQDEWWIFDVADNDVRVIAIVQFEHDQIWIRHVLTHVEYDQQKWKEDKRLSDKTRQAKKSSDKKNG